MFGLLLPIIARLESIADANMLFLTIVFILSILRRPNKLKIIEVKSSSFYESLKDTVVKKSNDSFYESVSIQCYVLTIGTTIGIGLFVIIVINKVRPRIAVVYHELVYLFPRLDGRSYNIGIDGILFNTLSKIMSTKKYIIININFTINGINTIRLSRK